MATAQEMGYVEVTNTEFDYYQAGVRSRDQTPEQATNNFDLLAHQYGVVSGSYSGSWDQFWMGYRGDQNDQA